MTGDREDIALQPTPGSQAPENPAAAPPIRQRMKLGPALARAFRHRNFRLYFAGQLVSMFGSWVQTVGLGWLVYRLTGSPAMLGIVTFAAQAPIFFLATAAGPLADRWDRRAIIIVTQSICMVQALLLAVLVFTDSAEITLVIALALSLGVVQALDTPTRQTFLMDMVGREDLRQAIAVNSLLFNAARMTGPAIGGLVVAYAGEGPCFLLNAFSYGAMVTSLLFMKLPRRVKLPPSHLFDDMKQGFAYVTTHPKIRTALLIVAAGGGLGMPMVHLMPAFALDVLQQGSQGYGYIVSAFGVGAFLAGLSLARVSEKRLPLMATGAVFGFGTGLFAVANTPTLPLAIALMIPTGFGSMMMAASVTTLVQILAEDRMRGRVMSFYTTCSQGTQPWGALCLGMIASQIGIANAIMLSGVLVALSGVWAFISFKRQGLFRRRTR